MDRAAITSTVEPQVLAARICANIARVMSGQTPTIERVLAAYLGGGLARGPHEMAIEWASGSAAKHRLTRARCARSLSSTAATASIPRASLKRSARG